MSTVDDGGSAFPILPPLDPEGSSASGYPYPDAGLTLRDWFAGQAIEIVDPNGVHEYELTALFGPHRTGTKREEIMAAQAYRIADAMIAERSRDRS